MNIGIITNYPDSKTTAHIQRAITVAGHSGIVIQPDTLGEDTSRLPVIDAAIVRFSPRTATQVMTICEHYAAQGIPLTVSPEGLCIAADKYRTAQVFQQQGIPTPDTVKVNSTDTPGALDSVSYPVIVKLPITSQGNGVALVESKRSARGVIDILIGLGQEVLLQEYIAEAKASDIRIIVVDGVVVAAMRRTSPQSDEFRSNISLGATGEPYVTTPEMDQIAIRAAQAVQCSVAGVDIILSNRGPLVLEVNASPGLAIQNIVQTDIAARYVAYLEQTLVKNRQS